jgi:hypothetical protein
MIGLLNFGYHQASNSSAILITQRIKRVGKTWRWDRPDYLKYTPENCFLQAAFNAFGSFSIYFHLNYLSLLDS